MDSLHHLLSCVFFHPFFLAPSTQRHHCQYLGQHNRNKINAIFGYCYAKQVDEKLISSHKIHISYIRKINVFPLSSSHLAVHLIKKQTALFKSAVTLLGNLQFGIVSI